MCEKHNYEVLFFCIECNKRLCGECIETFNKKKNEHSSHSVYNIKDLEKYHLFKPIDLYQKLIKKKNEYNEYIDKCDLNLNYLNILEEIRKKHLNQFQQFIKKKFETIIQNKEIIKKKISQRKTQLENEFPSLNILLNEILNKNEDEGIQKLKSKIQNYKNHNFLHNEESKSIISKEINVLSIDLFESKKFNIEINKNDEDTLGEKQLTISDLKVDFTMFKTIQGKVTFKITITQQDELNITSKFFVAIIINNYNQKLDKLLLNEISSNNGSFYHFSELYNINLLLDPQVSSNSNTFHIIISRIKFSL